MRKGSKLGRPQRQHGLTGTPEFNSLKAAIQRCTDLNHPSYSEYGGAGIYVHPPWVEDPLLFVAYLGPRPSGHEIDRIDNTKGYVPGNVRWATSKDQKLNRRNTVWIEAHGLRLSLTDWARRLKLDTKTIVHRMKVLKLSPDEALVPEKKVAGRSPKLLTHNGDTLSLSDWSRKLGLSKSTLTRRMQRGLSVEKVLAVPERN